MIISASRRTDIPAFYANWFMQRLRAGYVLVRNPMNFKQVSRVLVAQEHVECVVFWTKNPTALLANLTEIDDLGYRYYFLFTLTPYDSSIEPNVPAIEERIATFQTLADKIGREKVLWRYDPILFTDRYSTDFHTAAFAGIAGQLAGCTERCIVSFVEMYRKCRRNMKNLSLVNPPLEKRIALLQNLQTIGADHGISLQACAAGDDLKNAGIPRGKCIDDHLVARVANATVQATKDKNQRPECGCIESIDIGAYNTCPHNCLYCYANSNRDSVAKNFANHNPYSPLLFGDIDENDKITERKLKQPRKRQLPLF